MNMRGPLTLLVLTLLAFCLAAVPAQAQERRSLFEVLFGSGEDTTTQQTQPQPRPQQSAPRRQPQQSAPAPRASAPSPTPSPQVEKNENARRIAVFGDSLAVDLSRALERFYAEDPSVIVRGEGVGSSGFVRDDYFNWNSAIREEVASDSFDVAVIAIGINDRQTLEGAEPLSAPWRSAYRSRLDDFLSVLRDAGKPIIWMELPPMEQPSYGGAMAQISSLHKDAVHSAGGEWIETFVRYMSEAGGYTANGPDLNGNIVSMRKSDGIHFSAAGADKLAFYVDRAITQYHGGGGSTVEVADHLAGTDAANMLRPPFQGLGQMRLVEMASLVQQI